MGVANGYFLEQQFTHHHFFYSEFSVGVLQAHMCDQLPAGLLAQLIEHWGLNAIQAWIVSRL